MQNWKCYFASLPKHGEPVQRIADPEPGALESIDLEAVPPAEQADAVRRTIQEQVQQRFDLVRGPLCGRCSSGSDRRSTSCS